ncbi:MAG TPA: DUF4190 domain-containing protein [Blastocatellia bacterium]|nr:DUF4190 domain-containing protein [Blastocatellia bacterium]
MFCNQCGTDNKDDARFCRNCAAPLVKAAPPPEPQPPVVPSPPNYGYQPGQSVMPQEQSYQGYQSGYAGYNPPQQQSASGRAIASMILSLVSLVTCGPLLSVPGLILGKMELNAINAGQAPRAGETFAKIGYYAGIAVTALSALLIVSYILIIIAAIMSSGAR